MSIVVELPKDIEQKLSERASAAGLPIERVALEMIARGVGNRTSLDELLAPIRKQFSSRALTDSGLADLVEEAREEIWHEKQASKFLQRARSLSKNRRGLAHFAMPYEQNVPVPLSADGSQTGS